MMVLLGSFPKKFNSKKEYTSLITIQLHLIANSLFKQYKSKKNTFSKQSAEVYNINSVFIDFQPETLQFSQQGSL